MLTETVNGGIISFAHKKRGQHLKKERFLWIKIRQKINLKKMKKVVDKAKKI